MSIKVEIHAISENRRWVSDIVYFTDSNDAWLFVNRFNKELSGDINHHKIAMSPVRLDNIIDDILLTTLLQLKKELNNINLTKIKPNVLMSTPENKVTSILITPIH